MTSLKEFTPYAPRAATLKRKESLSEYVTLFEFSQDNGRPLAHKPGQFIQVSVYGVGEAPFSISSRPRVGSNSFEIAVRRIGAVTTALHNLEPGDKVGIRGPFGSSFPVQEFVGKDTLFIAGGLGYIPLRSLLRYQLRHRDEFGRIIVMIGCRSPEERIFVTEIENLAKRDDVEVLETVDCPNGSWSGNVGVITTLLPKVELDVENTHVAMVGPPVMYKFVIGSCVSDQCISPDRIYVSLERKMKCGLGKCGHCQINGISACIEGPVFRYTDIDLLKEAL
ncbi:MAG: FAD/NAD(P)-binding protein [Proteobacteria bacterium]|nr:FAD/NAD(P)-binding protein [Pseudomonadota bacterium]